MSNVEAQSSKLKAQVAIHPLALREPQGDERECRMSNVECPMSNVHSRIRERRKRREEDAEYEYENEYQN